MEDQESKTSTDRDVPCPPPGPLRPNGDGCAPVQVRSERVGPVVTPPPGLIPPKFGNLLRLDLTGDWPGRVDPLVLVLQIVNVEVTPDTTHDDPPLSAISHRVLFTA